ncbi:MAG: thioredoxin domain-containing protein [Patescibacteria group bacterium]|nr:MAG: thioredoxin domain-containing protein [Patescibacteria group bacterium]
MNRRGVASTGLLLVSGLALALALLFLWRVWGYYRMLSSGGPVDLPQYASQFTLTGRTGEVPKGAFADVATSDDPSIGPIDAKLTIVEFVDYECPFCNIESSVVRELAAKYQDKVRWIIRDFPVPELHPQAVTAAEAAGCAEAQDKYWPMHDRLYAAAFNNELTREEIDRAAEQSGLDMAVYRACMNLHARLTEIQDDAAAGLAAGVRGTPTFFVNGSRVEGAIPKDAFETIIRRYVTP